MPLQSKFLISTTPTIQDQPIEEYLGIVTSHVVAGTNLFSDMFAGLSDIFGGRSETYQKQIHSINNEASYLLEKDAKRRGANAIVSFSIDHDEISGSGKSMFMVTAIGTAVRLSDKEKGNDVSNINRSETVDFISIDNKMEELKLIKLAKKGTKGLSSEKFWNKLLELNLHVVIPDILNTLTNIKQDSIMERESKFYQYAKLFLTSIDRDLILEYKELIYKSSIPQDFFKELVYYQKLVDYKIVEYMLQSDNLLLKRNSIRSLSFHKYSYTV